MKRIIFLIICLSSMLSMNAQVECEDTCSHIHGIDLSHYQGNVFWEAIGDNSKMAYVYLKATEGGDRVDDKYKENIEIAHRYGLKVGSYHFYRPRIAQETQLANFMAQCRPGDQDLIPMIDIETRSGLSQEAFTDSLFKFLDLIEEAYKQKPLIYVGTNFYNNNLQNKLNDYKIMVAQYTQREPVLSDNRDITIWQYTGKGHINGITGYVDKSRFLGKHRLREIRFRHR
ncbi:MAG: glycosyl hydrolase family 25 [Prevotella sp.]|nr:glycosyl hydrolase family 25 [Prevotella sp.]MCI1281660.1 glycosyl hydrolase family 25 [Prevotella sp.]